MVLDYLPGQNIIVLDLEVEKSPDACIHCGELLELHFGNDRCEPNFEKRRFEAIGWRRLRHLGLSIGCYYDYKTGRLHWIDRRNLHIVVSTLVDSQPLMVSFNGIRFDFALMRAILREDPRNDPMCDDFKALAAMSYDILAQIWQVDPKGRFERGLNSLDAICARNGLGRKLMNGAQAPVMWQHREYAAVLDYVSDDVYKTKALFEMIIANNGKLLRGGDAEAIQLMLPQPKAIGIV
jgi:hypothetical protein